MSDNNVLRPHHALCTTFFEGKGYSGDFTENMERVIERLEQCDPILTIAAENDMICSHCPNSRGSSCVTEKKVQRYDNAVLRLCGLDNRQVIRWSELKKLVRENIIKPQRLDEVCGDCKWQYICGGQL